ncbi:MAG: putative baseplate assembly protein [Candidatus Korobacteraceae bacterium]
MIYSCCNEHRRAAVLGNPLLNGIDYLELADDSKIPASPFQQTLLIYCLNATPSIVGRNNILITGGESITGITAAWVLPASTTTAPANTASPAEVAYFKNELGNNPNVLVVRTSVAGDFSPYTLKLVNDASAAAQDSFAVTEVLSGFDLQLAEVPFSFKIDCPPDFDCKPPAPNCPPDLPTPPSINYLAKDYGSFRTILLDRLNQLLPSWGATSEADLGVALAELMAYVGDQLSYQQDAVATEAYLLTARSRISLRRHARLVDYLVHDGCNARAWIQLNVSDPLTLDPKVTRFYTSAPRVPANLAPGAGNEQAALDAGVVVFEPMQSKNLFPEHNQMSFYTWGDTDCCLPQGATEATLLGSYPNLQVGDVLIFQEVLGPQTGVVADADIRHRYVVRLTSVATQNAQGQPLVDPLFEQVTGAAITRSSQTPTAITEIQWSEDDALPATLCLSSSFTGSDGKAVNLGNVSVAYGNVVLADHGLSMPATALPAVPEPTLFYPPSAAQDHCNPTAAAPFPVRYRPVLEQSPVTQAVTLPLSGSPVTATAVPLLPTGFVTLSDSKGFATLMVRPNAPTSWPQYFGVIATSNEPAFPTFDLKVVFNPPGTPPNKWITLEHFSGLTLTPNVSNNAAVQINGVSQFVTVTPIGTTTPTNFPGTPNNFPNSGTLTLEDSSATAYLTVQPTNPLSWPPNLAVLAQGDLTTPEQFNLVLIYQPPSGGVGVQVPLVVKAFNDLTLATVAATFNSASALLTVLSFEGEPNPGLSAYELMHYDASKALPVINLAVNNETAKWASVADLLGSASADKNFVVEIEYNGAAYLRFGNDTNGARPISLTQFTASYRLGNGTAGNVGADSLINCASDPRIEACINPLPASGGIDPETVAQIRRRAPQAFLTQERAITMADYANVTMQNPQVEDAYATLRWTGSWYTVFITAEPQTGETLSKSQTCAVTNYVNRYRLAGQDLQLEQPEYVSLDIKLVVCVDPDYFQADVQQGLAQVLGSGCLPNGQPAFFSASNFKLGQTVYLSPIYAAARKVAGVQSVTAHKFQPQGVNTKAYLQTGEIPLGPFQVARLDNDPSRPANGQLTLVMKGGK